VNPSYILYGDIEPEIFENIVEIVEKKEYACQQFIT